MSEWVQKLRDNTQAFSWHDRQEVAFELELIASQLREAREQLVCAKHDAICECVTIAEANYSLMFTKAEHREVARKVSGTIAEQLRNRLPAQIDEQGNPK